jgi:ABC-2 type transport system ATP-binding protein
VIKEASFVETERSQELVISTAHLTKVFEAGPAAGLASVLRVRSAASGRAAVQDLNLEVMRGDVFGFLGPNGAGKTTTIRMLLGLIRPTAGSISMFGMASAAHLGEILRRIGAIVETPVFYPYLSGIDNLRIVAAASGMKPGRANQARIDEVLDMVDLRGRAADTYRKYSLGMKQRLAIAAVMLTDPELIMLDEPTNGLDPAGVRETRQLILRLAAAGKTIFLSSHILYEVQQVCNRVAILQQGKLIMQGNVQELLNSDEQLLVRLATAEETEQARVILEQASRDNMEWISRVARDSDTRGLPALLIDSPVSRSQEITALLAQNGLFIAEMYKHQTSLEDLFLELTGTDAGEGSRANTGASKGDRGLPSTDSMRHLLTSHRKRGT